MIKRLCKKCQETKAEKDFPRKSDGRLLGNCLECRRKSKKEHYERNKAVYIERAQKANLERRKKLMELRDALKRSPCKDCGKSYPPYVMDFDHREGTQKITHVSRMLSWSTEKALLEEIEKCDVVCANCHRERTHRRSLMNK